MSAVHHRTWSLAAGSRASAMPGPAASGDEATGPHLLALGIRGALTEGRLVLAVHAEWQRPGRVRWWVGVSVRGMGGCCQKVSLDSAPRRDP
jgi:hypothetical protein